SNSSAIDWASGKHATTISLPYSPQGGASNVQATLSAVLNDVSMSPASPIAGAAIQFSVGPWSCNGNTNANGLATCALTPTQDGIFSITATFGGSGGYSPAAVTGNFIVGTPQSTLDVDASVIATKYDALTDGLLVLRYLFGLTGPSLVN